MSEQPAAVEPRTQPQPPPAPVEPPGRQELRRVLQDRADAGKQVTTAQLKKFTGEPWADAILAQRTPRKPTSPDAISSRRAELQDQLRDLVVRENGPGIADISSTHPLAMQVMRGEQSPGKLISLDTAVSEAQKLPDDHPARVVLHNLRELEKNPRGTKVQAVDTNDVPDGTRVVVRDGETFTIDKENGIVEDGVRGEIPEGGMKLYGKQVLPPAEHPQASEPFVPAERAAQKTLPAPGDTQSEVPFPTQRQTESLKQALAENPKQYPTIARVDDEGALVPATGGFSSKDYDRLIARARELMPESPILQAPSPAESKGIFGQHVTEPAGIGAQGPLFHEPNAAAPVPRETVGSAEANKPENTVAMFPGGPKRGPAPKQPWEMSAREWADQWDQTRANAQGTGGDRGIGGMGRATSEQGLAARVKAITDRRDFLKMGLPSRPDAMGEMSPPTHADVVAEAVRQGKPVPPEVLADYPELAQAAPAPKLGDTVSALSRGGQPVSGVVKRIAGKLAQVDRGDGETILVKAESMKPFTAGGPNSSLSAAGINDPYMDARAGVSSLKNLTEQVGKVAADKPSIVQRMLAGSKVGETVSDTSAAPAPAAETASAYDRLKGSMAAMFDAYKSPPKDTTYDKATRFWSGADNISAMEIQRFRKSVEQAVPDKIDRGAIGVYMEAGGDQAKLDQWAKDIAGNAKTKRYAAIFDRAAQLIEPHKLIADSTAVRNDATLNEAKEAGLLKDGVENYLMHVWADNPAQLRKVAAEANWTSLVTSPGFTKQRTIPTYFEGIKKGLVPKDLDFASLTAAHERSFREALAARAYIKTLTTAKASDGRPLVTISPASAREVPGTEQKPNPAYLIKPNLRAGDNYADYRPVDHPALRGWKWAGNDSGGSPTIVQGDMLVHPEAYRSLKNNLTPSAIQTYEMNVAGHTIRPGAALLSASAQAKQFVLSLSGFHQTTLAVHGAEHRVVPAGMPDIDVENPVHKGLLDHGLMVAHYNAAEAFGEGVSSGGIINKIPVIGPLYHAYTDYLFKDYMPRLKMAMATDALERNQQRYGDTLTKDQMYSLTADQANAAFGGLNYRALGRNRTFQDVLRLTLMAPDFLEARTRFAAQALKPYGREQATALVLGAAAMYTAGRVLNQMLDGDPHWDKPFSVVHQGKEYSLRTVQGDLVDLVRDPVHFLQNRLSPPAQFMAALGDRSDHRTLGAKSASAAKGLAPIPAQPFVSGTSTDSPAQRIVNTIFKLIGVNARSEDAGKQPLNAADQERRQSREAAVKALREHAPDADAAMSKVPPSQRPEVRRQALRTDAENEMEHWTADKSLEFYLKQPRDVQQKLAPRLRLKIRGSTVHDGKQKQEMLRRLAGATTQPAS